jgi:hypothetical protein
MENAQKENQQVTNALQQVDTSEAACPLTSKFHYIAGLIDGDGSLLLSKKGFPSCEITMGLEDERALALVQSIFGGSIKPRSGVKAIQYRLSNIAGITNLINSVNGLIRHSIRSVQLQKLSTKYNIPYLTPIVLNSNSGWYAGFFDADGTVTMNKTTYQLTISVTNKNRIDVLPFLERFGGSVFYDKSQNGYYKWSISAKQDIFNFLEYIKINSLFSHKSKRLHLIPKYYELKELKAHNSKDPLLNKAWLQFLNKWG